MAKTIRNQYYKNLTYEKLMDAHIKSRKGKTSKDEIILFNLKQEEYIKHNLKIKYYYRYMDDSIILVKNKKEAKETLKKIRIFLKEKLGLELNKKTQIFKSKQGVNFCGYKINGYRMKIRDRGKRKLKKKIKYLKGEIQKGKISSKEAKKYLAGHLGYIKIANVNNLKNKLFYIEKE